MEFQSWALGTPDTGSFGGKMCDKGSTSFYALDSNQWEGLLGEGSSSSRRGMTSAVEESCKRIYFLGLNIYLHCGNQTSQRTRDGHPSKNSPHIIHHQENSHPKKSPTYMIQLHYTTLHHTHTQSSHLIPSLRSALAHYSTSSAGPDTRLRALGALGALRRRHGQRMDFVARTDGGW